MSADPSAEDPVGRIAESFVERYRRGERPSVEEYARVHPEVADEVRRHFGPLVYNTVIPRDVSLSEAPSHGKSILQYNPRARGAKGYVDLAREFMARDDARPISEEARINGQNQTR